jgi:hypothetical protein
MYGVSGGDYAGKALCYDCTVQLVKQNIAEVDKLRGRNQVVSLIIGFITTPLKQLWRMLKCIDAQAPIGAMFEGIKLLLFPLVAIYRIIVLRNQMSRANEIIASDERALREMRDYFAYTQTLESNKGVDLASLAGQGGALFDNTFAQNVLKQGEKAAQAQLRKSVVTISENGEILRSFNDDGLPKKKKKAA